MQIEIGIPSYLLSERERRMLELVARRPRFQKELVGLIGNNVVVNEVYKSLVRKGIGIMRFRFTGTKEGVKRPKKKVAPFTVYFFEGDEERVWGMLVKKKLLPHNKWTEIGIPLLGYNKVVNNPYGYREYRKEGRKCRGKG
ncbi:MAG: hypothetical protein J7L62_04060 [Candidatus Aminicenantes bacterium]|nr:hypothetical protein [Candidatus Aminicenantes bacterium]